MEYLKRVAAKSQHESEQTSTQPRVLIVDDNINSGEIYRQIGDLPKELLLQIDYCFLLIKGDLLNPANHELLVIQDDTIINIDGEK